MAKIAILHNNIDKTRNYVLRRENVLGRLPECNIFFDDQRVSRHHARIAVVPGTDHYFIEDISARGTYVNFRRIRARHPLKEADRICLLAFHNVHPVELERMTPEVLKQCADDPRNHNITAIVDVTFGYIDPQEAAAMPVAPTPSAAQTPTEPQRPQGLLDRLRALLHREKLEPPPKHAPAEKPEPKEPPKPLPPKEHGKDKETDTEKAKKSADWKSSRHDRYKL